MCLNRKVKSDRLVIPLAGQTWGCLPSGTDSYLVPFSFSEKVTK
jgi:hypothetical protein